MTLTYLETLQQGRTQIANLILEVTASPKPSYSYEGKSVSWSDYLATLTRQLGEFDKLIALQSGPFQVFGRLRG